MADAYYSNVALPTTLSGSISSGATTITVGATTGFPGSFPYTLALDYGAGTEELVQVTAAAGLNLTVTRGFSGTSAQSHSLGAAVRHVYHAGDATDFRSHQDATTDIHGVTGALVGATQTQTLTNKTLTSPTINSGTLAGGALSGTFTGSPTFSGAPTFSGVVAMSNVLAFTRSDATFTTINHRVSGDSSSRLTQQADGKLVWGSGSATGDTNLYRAEADTLATDDAFRVIRSATTGDVLQTQVSGDVGFRYLMEANGGMGWGDGTSTTMDTNLYRSAADTLRTDDHFIVGGNLTVTGVGRVLPAVKTADTSKASTTTVTADTHLSVSVVANARYIIEGALFYTSTSVTPDFLMLVSGPASSSGYWTLAAPSAGSTSDPDAVRTIATAIGSGRSYGVSTASQVFGGNLYGMLETAGTAGTCAIEWAQFTSDATSTTLKEHSWIRLTRVS